MHLVISNKNSVNWKIRWIPTVAKKRKDENYVLHAVDLYIIIALIRVEYNTFTDFGVMRVRKSLFQRVMCDFNSVVGNLVIIIVDSCSSTAVVTFVKTTKQSSSHILWPRYCSRLAFWHLPLLSALLDQSSLAKLHDRNDICYIKKPASFAPIFLGGGGISPNLE